ncbi:MAG TPA: bifunctional diaminohydroxyphosphoribosylaminopyrimidine deaminase/5-amino-6-(5-phosphoribosylamino)uracil reductase RibD [Burkholderiales bacterium]|nr:bifunctional diaminohydroxyphosphoribosylaminopyrimidine deaminase/5-amino-6-(5-phosphoribosylamino)uracil reductase RibD [Burkholderiales bacterium]
MFNEFDRLMMVHALALAERGLYTTTPNPRVGCVIVQQGKVVGEGFHKRAGEPHAEIHALRAAGSEARGATLYVTLEPCSHHGRTPPCVNALIDAGVARVVIAMQDPNPLVAGQGAARLQTAGIQTETGLLESEARELNIGFAARMTRGRPWVRLKVAASLDGKTAMANGQSQWITGEDARRDGHHFRARACAVLTGIGTVRDDDPQMTVRAVETTRQPLKILVDSNLDIPLGAKLLKGGSLLIACAQLNPEKAAALRDRGAEVLVLPNAHGKVELNELMRELASRELNEIHVEAGFKLNGSLLMEGVVDELLCYFAPRLIGHAGLGMFNLPELQRLEAAPALDIFDVGTIGSDLRMRARVR